MHDSSNYITVICFMKFHKILLNMQVLFWTGNIQMLNYPFSSANR